MTSAKKYLFFDESLADICSHSLVASGRNLRWIILANPSAGGFTISSRWKKGSHAIEEIRKKAKSNPKREICMPAKIIDKVNDRHLCGSGLLLTEMKGDAAEFTKMLIGEAEINSSYFYLIITAGGDGTSLEVLSALFHAPAAIRSNMAILRLPMGTGNDGSDSPYLYDALELLIKPTQIQFAPALRLLTAPGGPAEDKGPYLAFNILSVGLDAFVTHMTNKMKGKLPGDFYKLWVDIASLLYDRIYKVDFMNVQATDMHGSEIITLYEKLLLLAVGASGHRTYGSQKKILPDDRNVCAIRQTKLLRKLTLKGLFSTGTHINRPEAILFNAHKVEFSALHPILAQMDGETVLLQTKDFPAAIELSEAVIPVLKPA